MSITASFSAINKNRVQPGKQFLKQFFSRKDVSVVCFIVAIGIKVLLTFYFNQVETDKLFQAIAGKNFIEGHGITIKQVHVANLSKEYYEPLQGWPPGYSLIAGLIYFLVKDLDTACLIIDIIVAILFFIGLKKIFKQLSFPVYLINLLLLFQASWMPFCMTYSWPTDFLSLVLYIYICSLSIDVFHGKHAGFKTILLSFLNFTPAWFKYTYLPVSFVVPAFFLWNGWKKKDKKLFKYGLTILSLAIVSTVSLYLVQVPYSKPADYLTISETGIFWSNLLQVYPFSFSVITLDFYLMQLSSFSGIGYTAWLKILEWINLVLFFLMLIRFLYFSFKKDWLASSPWQVFIMIGGLIGCSIFIVIAFMSLTHNNHFPPPRTIVWTYLAEERYFIFLEFFVFIVVVHSLFINEVIAFKLKKTLKGIFLLIIALEIFHAIYFLEKNFTPDRRNFTYVSRKNRINNYIQNIIKENKQKNVEVVVANGAMTNRAVLNGGKGLFETSELLSPQFHASKPTLLIAAILSSQLIFYSRFINKNGVRLINQIGGIYFYSYFIESNNQ